MLASNLSLDESTLISAVLDGTCPSIFGKRYLRIARRASNRFLPSQSPASCYLASSVTNLFKHCSVPATDGYCTSRKSLGSATKFYVSC